MVFCNSHTQDSTCRKKKSHNPYFNRWFSAMSNINTFSYIKSVVTILILIDGFLQYGFFECIIVCITVTILILIDGFLQFSYTSNKHLFKKCHNPYFNRWFSAIAYFTFDKNNQYESQSLF